METLWSAVHRPVLRQVATEFDRGRAVFDPHEFALVSGLTVEQINASVRLLCEARFVDAQLLAGCWQITRICPLTRQILGSRPAATPSTASLSAWSAVDRIRSDSHPATSDPGTGAATITP